MQCKQFYFKDLFLASTQYQARLLLLGPSLLRAAYDRAPLTTAKRHRHPKHKETSY